MTCTAFIATSLDGFIARKDGGIDWLPVPEPGGEDYGYGAFIDSIDAIVMGRHTFELALTFGDWPYTKPVVVLTNRPAALPSTLPPKVRTLAGAPDRIIEQLSKTGAAHLYVDGGVTIQRFLAAGLLDRMIITRVPVLIGDGLPLFGPLEHDVPLQHVATRSYPNGLVQSEYRVLR